MENPNPTLREYFAKLIPDNSIFTYLEQHLSETEYKSSEYESGNHLDYSVPYFTAITTNTEDDGTSSQSSKLLRGYYRINAKGSTYKLSDLLTLGPDYSGKDILQCAEIMNILPALSEEEDEDKYYMYYIAISCKPGRKIKFTEKALSILGVAF